MVTHVNCNIFLQLQCSFDESKGIKVTHIQPELARLEIPLNQAKIAVPSQEKLQVRLWLNFQLFCNFTN